MEEKRRWTPGKRGFHRLDDIENFPFTDKQALIKDQQDNPPFGRRLCVPLREGAACKSHERDIGNGSGGARWADERIKGLERVTYMEKRPG
ncbi:MAG: hypothetical protein PHS17_15280 [Desulfobacterales bacterium]|nr:hypothetical protein [Desulfobacterales bacterium]